MPSQRPALVLLSGGLDSLAALAWAYQHHFTLQGAISFIYGQLHVREVEAATAIASFYDLPHQIVTLPSINGSKLTNLGSVPLGRDISSLSENIAPTYVPNRNMIFLAYTAAQALLSDVSYLIGGWNAADASNYPDCRESFLASVEYSLKLATLRKFTIVRPLIQDDKQAIIKRALNCQAPLHLTWTCYLGGEQACGRCDACQLRIAAFQSEEVIDPVQYAISVDWTGCRPYTESKI